MIVAEQLKTYSGEILEQTGVELLAVPVEVEPVAVASGGIVVRELVQVNSVIEAEMTQEDLELLADLEEALLDYEEGRVVHDDAADKFVAKAEALWLDAVFMERFEEAQMIANRKHELCNHDHELQNKMEQNGLFGIHDENDGHGHEKQDFDKDRNKKHTSKCSSRNGRKCDCK